MLTTNNPSIWHQKQQSCTYPSGFCEVLLNPCEVEVWHTGINATIPEHVTSICARASGDDAVACQDASTVSGLEI